MSKKKYKLKHQEEYSHEFGIYAPASETDKLGKGLPKWLSKKKDKKKEKDSKEEEQKRKK
ncbi:hypothetical protein [Shouchella shacheensis]|uniref:hypothetical protein n=1 Tax=Shouchella shacheensis TaxID=1649580 RepID=UPI00073FE210|nr:hypothetical protein [Shouchella shacheensis]